MLNFFIKLLKLISLNNIIKESMFRLYSYIKTLCIFKYFIYDKRWDICYLYSDYTYSINETHQFVFVYILDPIVNMLFQQWLYFYYVLQDLEAHRRALPRNYTEGNVWGTSNNYFYANISGLQCIGFIDSGWLGDIPVDDGSEQIWRYVPSTHRFRTVMYPWYDIRNYINIYILLPRGGGIWVEGPYATAINNTIGYILYSGANVY